MKDLHTLLGDQLKHIPIPKGKYFYDDTKEEFYSLRGTKIGKIEGIINHSNKDNPTIVFTFSDGSYKKVSKYRLICYVRNGLPEGIDFLNSNYVNAIKTPLGNYEWITASEKQMQFNVDRLKQVFIDHPELNSKHGFYDEGPIPYRYREGFFIVPLTNGTFAINPKTQEAVFTYSNELLSPHFHERGDRKYSLNSRLCSGKTTIISSRAIAYVSIPIPKKYAHYGETIKEVAEALDIDHIDANPSNNSIENLQWLNRQENLCKKLNQEGDPRVFPSTWLSPDKRQVRFRSHREAAKAIGCNQAAVIKVCKGWRKNVDEVNGWKLLEGKIEHPLERVYSNLELFSVDRAQLTHFKNRYAVYNIKTKQFSCYDNLHEMCSGCGIFVSGLDTHLGMRGPLVPYNDLVIFPERFMNALLQIGYFNIYNEVKVT